GGPVRNVSAVALGMTPLAALPASVAVEAGALVHEAARDSNGAAPVGRDPGAPRCVPARFGLEGAPIANHVAAAPNGPAALSCGVAADFDHPAADFDHPAADFDHPAAGFTDPAALSDGV